jgi:hypothetical protein
MKAHLGLDGRGAPQQFISAARYDWFMQVSQDPKADAAESFS